MATADVYIVHLNEPLNTDGKPQEGDLLSLHPYTLSDAMEAIRWQAMGGFDPRLFVLARPRKGLPSVFETKPHGTATPLLVDRGAFTKEAWADALVRIWGEG